MIRGPDELVLDLARCVLDGKALDWAAEWTEESEVLEGMERLEPLLRATNAIDGLNHAVPDFRLLRILGSGEIGVVYEAEQRDPPRSVALKVIRGGAHLSSGVLRRFQKETRDLTRLQHSGIAAFYETGPTDSLFPCFCMELVRGETLAAWIRGRPPGPMEPAELKLRLGLFGKICAAVAYAHQQGVIHGDLTPANALIPQPEKSSSMGDSVPDVKLLDFGMARITRADLPIETSPNVFARAMGALPYTSPERALGSTEDVDLHTDVYSLGAVLYHMVTGRPPYDFSDSGIMEIVRILREESPPSVSARFDGTHRLDADVTTIVETCLDKDPSRRYPSAVELEEDIRRYLNERPVLARPSSIAYRIRKFAIRPTGLSSVAMTKVVRAIGIARRWRQARQEAETAKRVSRVVETLLVVDDRAGTRDATTPTLEVHDAKTVRIDRLQGERSRHDSPRRSCASIVVERVEYARRLDELAHLLRRIGRDEEADRLAARAAASRQSSALEPDARLGTTRPWRRINE
ncbi:MAG TPA: serine/threonine-protein kinase, partial [Candidatus Polarisedimenticolaceae bacterium]